VSTEPSRQLVSGWGGAAATAATMLRPRSGDELEAVMAGDAASTRGCVPRGLGRSYGDAAQCAGGVVVDCTALDAVLELDSEVGRLRAEGGASFDALLKRLVPRGYFLPVTPGTRFVTLGGAIASDVHGKNHHVDGSFGAYVEELTLVTPTGRFSCGPGQHQDVFDATCGGMGLTGVVTEATLRLLPIATSSMVVDTERATDLEACMSLLSEERGRYRYSVAWIDGLASGRRLGRSVLTRGDHAQLSDLRPAQRGDPLAYGPRQLLAVPFAPPLSLLNPLSIAAFNEMWFRKAPRRRIGHLEPIASFFHPLDGVGRWNVLYGPHGFTQYQFVVPFGAEAAVRTVLERLSAARVASFLAVLKCFGRGGSGHLSFPAEGWTLALDIPLGSSGLAELLDGLDLVVAEAGGRVYLTKDGRLRPELLGAMYPRLEEWRAVRDRLDPRGVLCSDLGRRLGLSAGSTRSQGRQVA
jgi:decaprenylphospho-beta-D-ribofuranose 2-oxidase